MILIAVAGFVCVEKDGIVFRNHSYGSMRIAGSFKGVVLSKSRL